MLRSVIIAALLVMLAVPAHAEPNWFVRHKRFLIMESVAAAAKREVRR